MNSVADIDLADPRFWRRPARQRLDAFARLRRLDAPVFYAERGPSAGPSGGFHALVRHADVVTASRTPEVFVSRHGVTTPRPPRWVRAVFGDSMVNLDDPRHARLRSVVSRAFTPRVVARISADIGKLATRVVDDVVATGPADFVTAVAGPLPFHVICDMMGIPAAYREELLRRINATTERAGVQEGRRRLRVPGRGLAALARMHRVVAGVGRDRRRHPTDDLISALVTAEVAGRPLTGRELGAFFSLLLVAGVETTRNTIAHALWLLTAHPDQRDLLLSDFDGRVGGFVEEVVRYSSPIVQFRRTVARDFALNGHPLRAGDEVVMYYVSANRDETVFTEPDRFDITRTPNPHVGFGGGGPHFCLGASLARQEMTVLFRELLTRLPGLRSVGEPHLIASNFDNRIGRLDFTYSRKES
ncbi:cytochrome P450 [Phytohabitans rumicis]|uniref:Methyl-branched lipid omega-hydroxylase n=1 Tax=Phytohabitans rumicis TaxID=1076125 RepID=A0A6V8KTT8_9ACTN|nr:cytochrome P450 [Phytohabitans rumicis]GFJ87234.1 methyl-branched lipid omega-hydroxylase [Phytohabitans rumicis]